MHFNFSLKILWDIPNTCTCLPVIKKYADQQKVVNNDTAGMLDGTACTVNVYGYNFIIQLWL